MVHLFTVLNKKIQSFFKMITLIMSLHLQGIALLITKELIL